MELKKKAKLKKLNRLKCWKTYQEHNDCLGSRNEGPSGGEMAERARENGEKKIERRKQRSEEEEEAGSRFNDFFFN